MADSKFSDILRNPHFSQFVAMISVPYRSYHWRQRHPEVPFWIRIETITKLMHDGGLAHEKIRNQFIEAFVTLIVDLTEADPNLYYRVEDMDWFVQALEGEYATVTMSMLFAMASSRQTYVTPVQAAEHTDIAESTWRNRCADGEVVGATKAGKQWLIPVTTLRAYGYDVDSKVSRPLDEDEETD